MSDETAKDVIYKLQELNDWALDDRAAVAIVTRALTAERAKVWEMVIEKAEQAERDTADAIWVLEWAKAKAQEAL